MSGTFAETRFEFDAEIERLDERIADLEAQVEEMDNGTPGADAVTATLQQLRTRKKGVVWARDHAHESDDFPQWDEAVDGVTFGGLRAGTYGGLRDDLDADPDAGSGTSSTLVVAEGTVEAPYIDDDMTETERVSAVAQLHPFYREWAEARITALMDPESDVHDAGEGNGSNSDSSPAATSTSETPET